MAEQLAFLGLGRMGRPMAERVSRAGHAVSAWNRSPGRADGLEARLAATPADAVAGVDAVITMLSDGASVEDVLLGPEGAIEALRPDATLIEMSTIGPGAVHRIAGRLDGRPMLDAPVVGSVSHAEAGELTIVAGGNPDVFARWRDVLTTMGHPVHVGGAGAGATLKLVVNSCTASLPVLLGEALALAERAGLDRDVTLDALARTPMAILVERLRPRLEEGGFDPVFALSLAAKDLRLAEEAATSAGVDVTIARAAAERYRRAEADGLGGRDYSAVLAAILGEPGSA